MKGALPPVRNLSARPTVEKASTRREPSKATGCEFAEIRVQATFLWRNSQSRMSGQARTTAAWSMAPTAGAEVGALDDVDGAGEGDGGVSSTTGIAGVDARGAGPRDPDPGAAGAGVAGGWATGSAPLGGATGRSTGAEAGGVAAGGCVGGRAAPSGAGDPVDSRPPMSRRRSIRSRRAAYPSGPAAPGSRRRAMSSSSCKRGAVAPVISASPALTTSAARERPPVPNAAAWTCIRSS